MALGRRPREALVVGAEYLPWGIQAARAVVPATLIASDLARWGDAGNPDAHHADSVVAGRVSPRPVDSDEVGISLVLGLFPAVWLLAVALWLYLVLRRRLRLGAHPPSHSALWRCSGPSPPTGQVAHRQLSGERLVASRGVT